METSTSNLASSFTQLNNGLGGRVTSLETSFPAGCNTIMQAVTAKGVTPASNSPSDISTAISNISTGPVYDYIWKYKYICYSMISISSIKAYNIVVGFKYEDGAISSKTFCLSSTQSNTFGSVVYLYNFMRTNNTSNIGKRISNVENSDENYKDFHYALEGYYSSPYLDINAGLICNSTDYKFRFEMYVNPNTKNIDFGYQEPTSVSDFSNGTIGKYYVATSSKSTDYAWKRFVASKWQNYIESDYNGYGTNGDFTFVGIVWLY